MLQEMAEFSLTVGKSSSLLYSFLTTGALVKIRTQCAPVGKGGIIEDPLLHRFLSLVVLFPW